MAARARRAVREIQVDDERRRPPIVTDQIRHQRLEFVGPPKKEPWGTFAMFEDVDGNQFVLSSRWASRQRAIAGAGRCQSG